MEQTTDLIESIKPIVQRTRKARSIDALGKIWKYIAGTPDREDLEILTQNMNSLNTNNNRQTIINSNLNTQINKLIEITNTLSNHIKKDNDVGIEVMLNLQTKIRLIKEEIVNIKYALQYAKSNILNSMLLNKKEIKVALERIKTDNIPFHTIEEVLELSEISVLYNDLNLLYIIKIPITTKTIYETILIKPVKTANKIVNIQFNEIIRHKDEYYGIRNKTRIGYSINIYEKNVLLDISNSSCIPKMLNSLDSSCDITTAYHIPEIEVITPGLILLNDFSDKIMVDGEQKKLNGTFLVKFNNETIYIRDQKFSNFESIHLQTKPAIYQPTPLEKQNIRLLSLEALEELHLNNTKQIELLKTTTNVIGVSTIGFILVAIIVLSSIRCLQKEKVTIKIQEITKPIPESHTIPPLWSSPQSRGGGVI